MSSTFLKNLSAGELVRKAREKAGLSLAGMAYNLGVSESAVRHYEAGRREPDIGTLKRLADLADGELKAEIERRLPENFRGEIRIRVQGRRYSEEMVVAAHAALDAIIDHARSDIVKKVMDDLEKFAGRFGQKKS